MRKHCVNCSAILFIPDCCKVFKVLWSEPSGPDSSAQTVVSAQWNETFAVKIRWFVVIRPGSGYSSCLPIQTYSGRGVSKSSLVKAHHAIIYTGSREPKPISSERPRAGEGRMQMPGIRVDPKSKADRLDSMARVNFSKIYSVEHNVKVYEFGHVHRDFMGLFIKHFRACWNMDEDLFSDVDDSHSNVTIGNGKAEASDGTEADDD